MRLVLPFSVASYAGRRHGKFENKFRRQHRHPIAYYAVVIAQCFYLFFARSFYFARNSIKVCCSFLLAPATIGVRSPTASISFAYELAYCLFLMLSRCQVVVMLPEYFFSLFFLEEKNSKIFTWIQLIPILHPSIIF